MKRIPTENNPLFVWWKWNRWRKMIIQNNVITWVGKTYNELYPKMLVDFCTTPVYRKRKDPTTWLMVKEACEYPTTSAFRVKHRIPKSTWYDWVKNYPALSAAVELVKDQQEDMLIKNGLSWRWNAQVVKNVGMAEHDWSEKKETTTKREEITDDQKKKMFDEYMRSISQKWEVLDGNALMDESWESV